MAEEKNMSNFKHEVNNARNILNFSDDEIVEKVKAMQYDCCKVSALDKVVRSGRFMRMTKEQKQELIESIDSVTLPFHKGYLKFITGDINGAFKELLKVEAPFKAKLSNYISRNIGKIGGMIV